jgi:hypothetical protein
VPEPIQVTGEAFQAGFWDVSRTAYHADRTCDCHSTLEVFRRSIPLYHALFIKGSLPVPLATAEQNLGTAFHTLVLEPEKFASTVAVAPRVDGRTKKGKVALQQFQETLERSAALGVDRVVINQDQETTAQRMAEAVLRHPGAQDLLRAPGVVERALRWGDPLTRLPLRAMPDKLVQGGPTIDLKTAIDPTPGAFAKACANFGYHRQAALYLDARCCALSYKRPPKPPQVLGAAQRCTLWPADYDGTFIFIVIGKDPPHEVVLYLLDEQTLDLGARQNSLLLQELQDCKDFGRWRSRHQTDGGYPVPLSLPPWAFA